MFFFSSSVVIDEHNNIIDLTNYFDNEIMLESDNAILSTNTNNKTKVSDR